MRFTKVILATLLLVGVVPACDDNDVAQLRVVHASPDAPQVDIFVAGVTTPLITGLAYGQASPYVTVQPGDTTLIVRPTGTDTVVFQTQISIDDDHPVTAIATGDITSSDPSNSFRILPLEENFDNLHGTEANVRVVHASPDAPTIDVDIANDGTIDIAQLARFEDTGEDGIAVAARAPLQIGIDVGGAPFTAFTTPELPVGGDLFVIAIGNVTDLPRVMTGFSLLVVGPSGVIATIKQNPTVYVLHASPDAPAVDIFTGGTALVLDLGFGQLASVQVPPGDYTLDLFPAGNVGPTPFATAPLVGLAPGERYLAIATGMVTPVGNEQRFQVGLYADQFSIFGTPLLRAIHASPDAPVVDVSTATGRTLNTPPLFPELSFLEASPGEGMLVPTVLHLGVAPSRSTSAVVTFDLAILPTARTLAVLAGALTPAPGEQSFRLFAIDTAASPWTLTTFLPNPM